MSRHGDGDRRFVTRTIGTETIVVPVAGHVGDLECVYTLNEVATRIWELLETPRTPAQVANVLACEFEVDNAELVADVVKFLTILEASGLARAVPD